MLPRKNSDDLPSLRFPNVFVELALSESSSSPDYKRIKPLAVQLGDLLIAIEITSTASRDVDMKAKWTEYHDSDVNIYIIIDLAGTHTTGTIPLVIVGSLVPFSGSQPATDGYPGSYLSRNQTRSSPACYYTREYSGNQSIHLPGIPDLNWPTLSMTRAFLSSRTALKGATQRKKQENKEERVRRRAAERESNAKDEVISALERRVTELERN